MKKIFLLILLLSLSFPSIVFSEEEYTQEDLITCICEANSRYNKASKRRDKEEIAKEQTLIGQCLVVYERLYGKFHWKCKRR
jgi:hypothetical protein